MVVPLPGDDSISTSPPTRVTLFLHADQAEAAIGLTGCTLFPGIKSDPVILNYQDHIFVALFRQDGHIFCLGMFRNII